LPADMTSASASASGSACFPPTPAIPKARCVTPIWGSTKRKPPAEQRVDSTTRRWHAPSTRGRRPARAGSWAEIQMRSRVRRTRGVRDLLEVAEALRERGVALAVVDRRHRHRDRGGQDALCRSGCRRSVRARRAARANRRRHESRPEARDPRRPTPGAHGFTSCRSSANTVMSRKPHFDARVHF
jgi:hypothetical protein